MKKKSLTPTKSSPQKVLNNESLISHRETLDDFISKISSIPVVENPRIITPIKPTRQSPVKSIQTPKKTSETPSITPPITPNYQSEILVDDLEKSFTGMKLQLHNPKRRSEDRSTIEGSPVSMKSIECNNINDIDDIEYYHQPKKLDLHPTPIRVSSNSNFDNNLDDNNNLIKHVTNNFLNTNIDDGIITKEIKGENVVNNEYVGKIFVISSGSDAHDTGEHQENALRTALLCGNDGCLRRESVNNNIMWLNEDNNLIEAPISDLLRVHEYSYINHLEQKCRNSSINDNNIDENNYKLPNFYAPNGHLDADTPLVEQSLQASRKFCSAAMYAVDKVMNSNQSISRAFVIGRPPGHHAGPNGCVPSKYYWKRPDMASSGFCLLNTVAVAAAYTRSQYGRQALSNNLLGNINSGILNRPPKIAIVDIDVHHGNGTEEIIRNLRPHMVNLPLPSSWAPLAVSSYKPWLNEKDADDVFFASINLYAGERFYPCSGSDSHESSNNNNGHNIINIGLTPVGPGPWDAQGRKKLTANQRIELSHLASVELRNKVANQLIPYLKTFEPDILFISSGFDAHYDDAYHFLTESDFHWLTDELCKANGTCKVISILEGGYSLSSPIPKEKEVRVKRESVLKNDKTIKIEKIPSKIIDKKKLASKKSNDGLNQLSNENENQSNSPKDSDDNTNTKNSNNIDIKFAQLPGDGGLVKGVLAHVAALAGKESWI